MKNNDNNKKQPWTSRTILEAFASATQAGEAGRQYALARHHHIEQPKHSLDYARVYVNLGPRDDGRSMAVMA